jgi:uncharacterized protein (DUF488 family)
MHLKNFAPTKSIRQRQKEADEVYGVKKRNRELLGSEFIDGYKTDILDQCKLSDFHLQLPAQAKRPCLFCVERNPEACHRSLMSNWLSEEKVLHLKP